MAQVFLQELQIQLNAIAARLKEIENAAYQGPLSPAYLKKDEVEYWRLRRRRDELRQRVIYYEKETPHDHSKSQATHRRADQNH